MHDRLGCVLFPELRAAYAAARKELRGEIARAKARSADEFVATLNQDPWGRPYRAVSIKLGPWAPPVTEGLDPRFLTEVLSTLFPPPPVPGEDGVDGTGDPWLIRGADTSDAPGVSDEELASSITRMRQRNAAPGPDGVPGRVWACALSALGDGLQLVMGVIPLKQYRYLAVKYHGISSKYEYRRYQKVSIPK